MVTLISVCLTELNNILFRLNHVYLFSYCWYDDYFCHLPDFKILEIRKMSLLKWVLLSFDMNFSPHRKFAVTWENLFARKKPKN